MSNESIKTSIAEQIAQDLALPVENVGVQLAAKAIARLLAWDVEAKPQERTQLPPILWEGARQEACMYCLQTLFHLLSLDDGRLEGDPAAIQLYDDFLTQVRAYMESPSPNLEEQEPPLSLIERLKIEQIYWKQALESLRICQRFKSQLCKVNS